MNGARKRRQPVCFGVADTDGHKGQEPCAKDQQFRDDQDPHHQVAGQLVERAFSGYLVMRRPVGGRFRARLGSACRGLR